MESSFLIHRQSEHPLKETPFPRQLLLRLHFGTTALLVPFMGTSGSNLSHRHHSVSVSHAQTPTNMQTHSTGRPATHTHTPLHKHTPTQPQRGAGAAIQMWQLPYCLSPSFFLCRNRFPCSDLIPGSRIWALIKENDASGGDRHATQSMIHESKA